MKSCKRLLKLITERVDIGGVKARAQCAHNTRTLFFQHFTRGWTDKPGFSLNVSKLIARVPLCIMMLYRL